MESRLIKSLLTIVLYIGVLLGMASCKSGINELPTQEEGKKISFTTTQDNWPTKATLPLSINKIGIYAYSYSSTWNTVKNSNPKADFFTNKPVILKDKQWVYDGTIKYWPTDGRKLTFFAYSPYSDIDSTVVLAPVNTSPNGVPQIHFITHRDILKQVDLMWSKSSEDLTAGPVNFTMKHALAAIGFVVELDPQSQGMNEIARFEKITVKNVIRKGVFNLSTGSWALGTERGNFDLLPNRGLADIEIDTENLNNYDGPIHITNTSSADGDGFLMLIPQTFDDTSEITVQIRVYNRTEDKYETQENTYYPKGISLKAGQTVLLKL